MSPKKWREFLDGWGLEEVPAHLTRIEDGQADVGCCICGTYCRGKLYSQWVHCYQHAGTRKALTEALDRLASDSFCRYHAEMLHSP